MNMVALAKALIPQSHPLFPLIDKAAAMTGKYPSSKEGVQQLIREHNLSREQLQNAVNMLNNPVMGGLLNRINPALVENLRSMASQIVDMPAQSAQGMTEIQKSAPAAQGMSKALFLRQQLNKLRR